jgi:hypothetical protein
MPAWMARSTRAGVCLALLLALAGCRHAGGLVAVEGLAGGPPVFVNTNTLDGESAIIEGALALEGGCFVLTTDAGSSAVVWPEGMRPGEDGRSLVLTDGRRIAPGDEVEGGGGYHARDQQGRSGEVWEALAACPSTSGEIAVMNGNSEVSILD